MRSHAYLLAHPVFRAADMALATAMSTSGVCRFLSRCAEAGTVVAITRGLWAVPEHPHFSANGIVPYILAGSQGYISFLAALQRHGVISQLPQRLQIASTGHTRTLHSPVGEFQIIQMHPRYMQHGIAWHTQPAPHALASAEKALLDCLYLATRRKKQFRYLPEIDWQHLNLKNFHRLRQAHPYPPSIAQAIAQSFTQLHQQSTTLP